MYLLFSSNGPVASCLQTDSADPFGGKPAITSRFTKKSLATLYLSSDLKLYTANVYSRFSGSLLKKSITGKKLLKFSVWWYYTELLLAQVYDALLLLPEFNVTLKHQWILLAGIFFNTPEKKTRTQGQNSSQNSRKKLKLSEAIPSNFKNSRKNQLFP